MPTIKHVHDVTLAGTADLAYWKERLEMQGLVPADVDGAAEILIIASEGRFWGVRFRELSVSVRVPAVNGDAAYLVQAFNSVKFFAWSERRFFSTPYVHGGIGVTTTPPSLELLLSGERVLHAAIRDLGDRDPQIQPDAVWQGRVFIPQRSAREPQYFVAKINGEAIVCPFLAGQDTFEMKAAGSELLRILSEARFTPRLWIVRKDSIHQKSKTYKVP